MNSAELTQRVRLASILIQMLRRDDDPRAKSAIEELQRQQREINSQLVKTARAERAARGEPEPPPIRIGLKPLILTAKRGR